jgi:hypothetical protein
MMEALKRSLAQSQKPAAEPTHDKKPTRRTGTDLHRRKLAS